MGWCSIINIGLLLFSSVGLIVLRGPVLNIHSKITGIRQAELLPMYFRLLGNYKKVDNNLSSQKDPVLQRKEQGEDLKAKVKQDEGP